MSVKRINMQLRLFHIMRTIQSGATENEIGWELRTIMVSTIAEERGIPFETLWREFKDSERNPVQI